MNKVLYSLLLQFLCYLDGVVVVQPPDDLDLSQGVFDALRIRQNDLLHRHSFVAVRVDGWEHQAVPSVAQRLQVHVTWAQVKPVDVHQRLKLLRHLGFGVLTKFAIDFGGCSIQKWTNWLVIGYRRSCLVCNIVKIENVDGVTLTEDYCFPLSNPHRITRLSDSQPE